MHISELELKKPIYKIATIAIVTLITIIVINQEEEVQQQETPAHVICLTNNFL